MGKQKEKYLMEVVGTLKRALPRELKVNRQKQFISFYEDPTSGLFIASYSSPILYTGKKNWRDETEEVFDRLYRAKMSDGSSLYDYITAIKTHDKLGIDREKFNFSFFSRQEDSGVNMKVKKKINGSNECLEEILWHIRHGYLGSIDIIRGSTGSYRVTAK